ncbi:MAG: type II toxin-antitoxin system death-on-curing family toxin [Fibrobacterota bacterium]
MNREPRFLSISEVIEIHENEIKEAGGLSGIRDRNNLESAVAAPQASFENEFLMDIFEMAATYLNSIAMNHPFFDGNKRTALASALTFLFINGYEIDEIYDEELADKTLDLINRLISKSDMSNLFSTRCKAIE